jgi:hypothetical protein
MVWESGCAVIVMLTPLAENGVRQCHHYWPDEGSNLYHVYEVLRGGYLPVGLSAPVFGDYMVRSPRRQAQTWAGQSAPSILKGTRCHMARKGQWFHTVM